MKTRTFFQIGLILICLIGTSKVFAQGFTEQTGITFPAIKNGSTAWGDYNNDGYLDLLLTGMNGTFPISKIYKNNGDNTFTEQAGIILTGVYYSSVVWGDYNNDNFLDILITGHTGSIAISKIYKNNGDNTFTEQTGITLQGVFYSSVAWGDYNNDGNLDIALTGSSDGMGNTAITKIYCNNGNNTFTALSTSWTGLYYSSVAWGDYNNDGFLDLLLSGKAGTGTGYTFAEILKNNGDNTFSYDYNISISGIYNGSVAWGDYNNDNFLDIIVTGNSSATGIIPKSKLYKNNGGTSFDTLNISLAPVYASSVAWGDYDNDGLLDILLTGNNATTGINSVTKLYKNNGDDTFTEQIGTLLPDVSSSSVAWADFENDGKLDIILTGSLNSTTSATTLFKNNSLITNSAPSVPVNLQANAYIQDIILKWDASTDIETASAGLSYNIYIYQQGQPTFEISPQAIPQTQSMNGKRLLCQLGNIRHTADGYLVRNLIPGNYIWSVQAVDVNFAGSGFSTEASFTIYPLAEAIITVPGISSSAVAVGKLSYSNYPDIIFSGISDTGYVSGVLKNDGNYSFHTNQGLFISEISNGNISLGDYNNDNRMDILMSGNSVNGPVTKLYKNINDTVITIQTSILFKGVMNGSAAWGDYDNDGDFDILLAGNDGNIPVTLIYKNNGNNSFSLDSNISLTGVDHSSVAWGDYDNNGTLDILLTGNDGNAPVTKIYKNNGNGTFSEQTGFSITGVDYSSVAWGDYNNDGFLDFLLTGNSASGKVSKIYLNDSSSNFIEQTGISLIGIDHSSVAWGDYNNDGLLDLVLAGNSATGPVTKIYKNNGNGFFADQINLNCYGVMDGNVVWADFNNDKQLELFVSGINGVNRISKIYKVNIGQIFNTKPSAPANLLATYNVTDITFKWDKSTDAETPQNGLSYNLYLNKVSSGYKRSPQANTGNGDRNTFQIGDIQYDSTGYTIKNLPIGDYTWSVQAVDAGLMGSTFATATTTNIPQFHELETIFDSLYFDGSTADYDKDGKMDILFIDETVTGTRIFKNSGNLTFSEQTSIQMTDIRNGASAWADYNGDGLTDVLVAGNASDSSFSNLISTIYKNNGNNTFSEQTNINFPSGKHKSIIWGDFDNDGDQDLMLAIGILPKIYRNNGNNSFTELSDSQFPVISEGMAVCGDMNNDGYLDIVMSGYAAGSYITKVYKNNGNSTFSEQLSTNLSGIGYSSVDLGDYDNDGDLDVLLTGRNSSNNYYTLVFKNNGNFAFQQFTSLTGIRGCAKWGDLDNDGKLDIILSGFTGSTYITKLYKNTGTSFLNSATFQLPNYMSPKILLNDFDNDGDIDLLISGNTSDHHERTHLYRNFINNGNYAPSAPANLQTIVSGQNVILFWDKATDTETPQNGLSYNIYIYEASSPDHFLRSPNAFRQTDIKNGQRLVSQINNIQFNASGYPMCNLPSGTYKWSVQAIDAGMKGGPFSTEAEFTILPYIQGVENGSNAVGDFNKDGYLDLLISGNSSSGPVTKIYLNNGNNTFSELSSINLAGVKNSSVASGDYDNDGDLDLLITGNSGTNRVSLVYKNNGDSTFTEQTSISLTGVDHSAAAWFDYDNDGDIDIFLCGKTNTGRVTAIYKNNGDGSFTEQTGIAFPSVEYASIAIGDYDNNNTPDILLTGNTGTGKISKIYKNNGDNTFTEQMNILLTGVDSSSVAWCDYNSDGYIDILLTGCTATNIITKIYKNNGNNSFTELTVAVFEGVGTSGVAWGDYENDGDPDILLTGNNGINKVSKIYINNGNDTFSVDTILQLTNVDHSNAVWADIDNNGSLDIILAGSSNSGSSTVVYQNNIYANNTAPGIPTNLHAVVTGQNVTLFWDIVSDNETMQNGLSYNLYLYAEDSINFIRPPHALPQTALNNGWRLVSQIGNIQYNPLGYVINSLVLGTTYKWSVQAVDAGLKGSAFAPEKSFVASLFPEQTDIVFAPITNGSVAWGDYNNDGFLDILLSGYNNNLIYTKIYKNNGDNTFTEQTGISLDGTYQSSLAWGDYDNDGDLDILLTDHITKIYKNNGNNTFTDQITLTWVQQGSGVWGDYNNDGLLDMFLNGWDNSLNTYSAILRNNGNDSFTEQVTFNLTTIPKNGQWIDFNNDGLLDIFNGYTLYKNNGNNNFTIVSNTSIIPLAKASSDWADYDNDGYLDLIISGYDGTDTVLTKIYKNIGNASFVEQLIYNIPGVYNGNVKWGDLNNDGYVDVFISGYSYPNSITKIYKNNGNNTFTEVLNMPFVCNNEPEIALGDYNNDGNLDAIFIGKDIGDDYPKLYKNLWGTPASIPEAPLNLQSSVNGSNVTFHWDQMLGTKSIQTGYSYNLYVYNPGSGSFLTPSNAFPQTSVLNGWRKVPLLGNIQWSPSGYTLKNILFNNSLKWSVQAIAPNRAGGIFAPEADILTVGTDELYNYGLSVFPNPTSTGIVTITRDEITKGNGTVNIIVSDENNRQIKMFSSQEKQIQIDLSHEASGTYFILIQQNNVKLRTKIIYLK